MASRSWAKSARSKSLSLERFRATWIPVRAPKRQNENLEPRFDSIGTGEALATLKFTQSGLGVSPKSNEWLEDRYLIEHSLIADVRA